ncbi:hypothetical protein [Denitromonas iodatirespirans]|uniref:Uncharacterized protein n=1 Tax=Denitromonas iodatirespirans TaxID=2795389 RepID=A0A944DBB6_DENI1|nr:hypothetical protein [Denitromonas iodatirespirans]MBT0963615.1 hypothetical protein [Denitromonas iodatirespirans]
MRVIAEGQMNRTEGSEVVAKIKPEPLLFFRPATAEIVVVMPEHRAGFLRDASVVESVIAQMVLARAKAQTLEDDLLCDRAPSDSDRHHLAFRLDRALAEEAAARQKAKEALDGIDLNPGADLIELLPLSTRTNPQGLPRGKKFVYVRSQKVRNHWRGYKLSGADKPELKSFLTHTPGQGWRLDDRKLREGLRYVRGDVLKQLGQVKTTAKLEHELAKIEDEWMPDFAQAFNDNAHFASPEEAGDMAEYGGSARVLRAFAGASGALEGNFDGSLGGILKGELPTLKAAVKGKAEAGVMLAEGQADFKLFLPHRKGLQLLGIPALREELMSGKTVVDLLPMGYVRLSFTLGVNGAVGASLLAEGGVEVEFDANGTQKIKGRATARTADQIGRRSMVVNDKKAIKAEAGAKAEITAFAGASAEGSVKGALQWQKPESKEFGDFALIEPKIAGLAGIGGSAAFSIGYTGGKFKIVAKLSGCVGLGLSGKIAAEIGAEHIWEFACWFRHQVVAAGDQNLEYFEERAFESFSAMYTLAIVEGKELAAYLGREAREMTEELRLLIRNNRAAFLKAIKSSDDILLMASANVKGYLLEQLRQINKDLEEAKDEFDVQWRQMKLDVKETLEWLLSSVEQKTELENVYQHATVDFSKVADTAQAKTFVSRMLGEVQVAALDARLKDAPTSGHRLMRNTELAYQLQDSVHVAWNERAWWAHGTTT